MRKLKLFFACLLMAVLSIGQVWATDIVIDLDLSKAATYPSGFPTSSGTKTGTYTLGGYDFSFSCNNAFYFSTSYLMIGKSSKTVSSYITFPAIEDYKLTEVKLTASSGTSTNVAASIQDGSGNVLTGGTGWAFVQSGNNTWTLTETSANTAYKVCIYKNNTNNSTYNAQVAGLKLTYSPTGSTPPASVATPTFSPAAGVYTSAQSVTLSCETASSTIYYTTDGSDPDNTKTQYTGAINVDETTTIKAIAYVGSSASNVASATYTIVTPLATMQEIYDASEAAGSYYVTFNSNWVVTGVSSNGQNVYITDGEKGMILYNNGGNMGLVAGNTLSGTKQCSITRYGGAPEITNFSITGLTKGDGTLPSVQELDEAGVAALGAVNTGALIKVSGEYTAASYVGGAKLYNAIMALPTMTVGSTYECTGVYIYYKKNNTTDAVNEIAPRTTDDIKEVQAATLTEVNGLAELKAQELGSYLVTLNNAIVTYADDNNAFIEEANAGSLIYYQNGGHGLVKGDCLNGKYEVNTATYNGKFEITSITAQTGAEKTTAAIPVTTLTIAQLTADFAAYESMRIKIAGVNVTNAIEYNDRNGEISDGTNTFILFAGKNGLEAAENATIDVIGYPTFYVTSNANQHQLAVWAQEDIEDVTPTPKYTVRFWNSENWDNVKAHVWNNNGAITSWPGEDAQLGDDGWNYYEIEEGNSLLFNNGNGIQTVDITNVTADACYVLNGSADDLGHKYVEADCSDRFYIAGNTALTGENWNAAGARLENGSVTFYNVAESNDLEFKITNGTWKWSRGYLAFDGVCSDVGNTGTDNVIFATDAAKDITISYDKVNDKICVTLADPAAPDTRYKAEQTGFDAISGKLATVTEGTHQGKEYISYEAKQGAASTAPAINSNNEIRLYQNGGLLVIGAAKGCKIDQVFLTTGSSYSTTIGYSTTETEIATTGDAVGKGADWNTASGLNTDTVVIVCLGTTNKQRIDVAKLDVRYTGGPAAVHHYKLAGDYATVFNQYDAFNHNNLIVYAAYDELETDMLDITAECTFSTPDMSQAGEQTINITYNNAVVTSYNITITAVQTVKLKFYAPVAWENVKAYTWDGGEAIYPMTAVEEGSRWFECDMPKNVQFFIYNGSFEGLNQTENIAALDGPKCYAWATVSSNGKYNTIETCEMSYYIAGENLPEVTWNEGEHKAMTNNAVEFENLAAGTYKFKVTNNTWAWNLGYANADQTNSNITLADNNGDVQFTTTAAMNVTIAYNPATEKITVNGVLPPKPFDPNISFNKNAQKINSANVTTSADKDSYGNIWNITTEGTTSFTTNTAYEQVGSSNNPAESITFSTTLANNDEIAKISYIAIKLGGYNGTVGDVNIQVDGTIYEVGTLDGTNDVVIATTGTDPMMGREISIEIVNIDKGVKCYGIEYAYQKYEFVALKFFAPRDQTNKWDNVYAYAYDPANNAAYVAWPGEELTVKDAEFYVYNAPKGYNVIFHDYDGMQTNDIENVQETACYVPTAIDYQTKKVTLVAQCYVDYYVAGEEGFTGNNWDPANATCKFDENNQVVFHDVPEGTYQFKITNGSWAWSIGGEGFLSEEPGCGTIATEKGIGNTAFTIDEVQDVTITYYPATRKICLGALTVKTIGELTAYDIDNLYVDELKYPSFSTNISDYTAADVELTFVSGDECVAFVDGQIKGTAEGTAVVKVTIAETALFTGAEATFNVTVSAVPVPPTPQYETVRGGLEANRYYTLCFNRTMEAVQGATFWAFASKDANMAYLVQEDAPYAAGKPYIIYAEAAGDLTAVLSGDVETNPGVNGALHGTFSLMEQTHLNAAGENIYLLMNNQLRRVDGQSGNSLPAYRAYIDLDEIANTGAPANVPAHRVRAIPMHKDVVTGFENLNATDKPVKMLIDGNIYILRGEKMYDATGRLVK